MRKTMFAIPVLLVLSTSCSQKPPQVEDDRSAKESDSKLLQMSGPAQEHVGLRTVAVRMQEMQEFLHVVGTVQPMDTRVGQVRPLARGRVLSVLAKVGDRVREGQALAQFDNIEAGELSAQYRAALAELQRSKLQQASLQRISERNAELSNLGAIAKKSAESSEVEAQAAHESVLVQESVLAGFLQRLRRFGVDAATAAQATTAVRAPFAGVVIKAQTAPGDVVDADRELFSIADLSRVWVQAEVYEQDLGRVKVGEPAVISVDTYPEQQFHGQVTYLADILDPQTRTARVRCEVPNPEHRLKLDMFAAIELPTHFRRRALVIPASAIQDVNGVPTVFLRATRTTFKATPVKVGRILDEDAEILLGVHEGDSVVSVGAFHLKSIVLSGTIGEE